jgi:hypothetical protein
VLHAAPLCAQSLFASRGLGLLMDPISSRAAGLGGIPLGLPREISWADPASAVGLPASGLTVAFRTDAYRADYQGRSFSGQTARFPLILAAFPFRQRWAITAGFGSYLDQNWAVQSQDTILLGSNRVPVLDQLTSQGGVSRLRLAIARSIVPHVAISLGADVFTGGVQRTNGRSYSFILDGFARDSLVVNAGCCTASWTYSGAGGLASIDWTPSGALTVAASVSGGGTLHGDGRDSLTADRDYRLTTELSLGASGRITSNTIVAASTRWSGWSNLNAALADQGGARDAWTATGGVEWQGIQSAGRSVPLRLGVRYQQLPFRWSDTAAFPTDRAVTGGAGLILAGGAVSTDLAVERGRRGGSGAGLEESYWRVGLSVRIFGQ